MRICVMPVPVASGAAYAYVAALLLSLAFAHFSPYDTPQILLTARQGTCTSNMFEKTEAQMEGPFYLKAVSRKDITENLPGAPLTLRLAVKGRDCKPFPEGATVSIWHAAVDGTYRYGAVSVFPQHQAFLCSESDAARSWQ